MTREAFENWEFKGTVTVGTSPVDLLSGTGSPEGVVTAVKGSLFLRTDGSSNNTLYVKESGSGNTGWILFSSDQGLGGLPGIDGNIGTGGGGTGPTGPTGATGPAGSDGLPGLDSNGAGTVKRYATTIGNNSATSFDVDHNLGSLFVQVEVYRISDGLTIYTDVTRVNTNRVTIDTVSVPTTNELMVVVVG